MWSATRARSLDPVRLAERAKGHDGGRSAVLGIACERAIKHTHPRARLELIGLLEPQQCRRLRGEIARTNHHRVPAHRAMTPGDPQLDVAEAAVVRDHLRGAGP